MLIYHEYIPRVSVYASCYLRGRRATLLLCFEIRKFRDLARHSTCSTYHVLSVHNCCYLLLISVKTTTWIFNGLSYCLLIWTLVKQICDDLVLFLDRTEVLGL